MRKYVHFNNTLNKTSVKFIYCIFKCYNSVVITNIRWCVGLMMLMVQRTRFWIVLILISIFAFGIVLIFLGIFNICLIYYISDNNNNWQWDCDIARIGDEWKLLLFPIGLLGLIADILILAIACFVSYILMFVLSMVGISIEHVIAYFYHRLCCTKSSSEEIALIKNDI